MAPWALAQAGLTLQTRQLIGSGKAKGGRVKLWKISSVVQVVKA
jgi:hypothetical protein